jgi:predicted metalloprotease with PDZ domain
MFSYFSPEQRVPARHPLRSIKAYTDAALKQTSVRVTLFLFSLIWTAPSVAATRPIILQVDARDVTQGIQHVFLAIPVRPGSLTLAYPKWIPGEHAADGPLTQLVALQITSGSRVVAWRRDSLDPYSFHVNIPAGVNVLQVRFDYVSPPKSFGDGYGKAPDATAHLIILAFNHFILYLRDAAAASIEVKADVLIPAGWKFDSALRPERIEGGHIWLPQTSLYALVDSPLLAGEYFRMVPLTEGSGSTRMSIAADAPGDLAMSDAMVAGMRRVVVEATGLLGPGHYREYVWLLTLSDALDTQNGLEHHESTDIRDTENLFTDPDRLIETRILPHEYVHSWNGKYRRPEGLATRNYQQPMIDDLLWVYEGMTRYLGDFVLRARSGLSTPEQTRAYVAWIAALMDVDRPGRSWRSLGDTATALPGYNDAPGEWAAIRRTRDYYDEMLLIWLEADTLIRQNTNNKRSLDDFCHEFFGGPAGLPSVRPYSRADLVEALHAVAPLDWETFLSSRIDAINEHAPLEGIRASGWLLTYDDEPNVFFNAREKGDGAINLSLSLGMWVKPDGVVADVVNGSPAFQSGVAPAMRLLAIGGRKWSMNAARDAIVNAEKASQPIELIVESADIVRVLHVGYHAGLRNPHLTRNPERPDLLSQIIAPKFTIMP